MTITSVLPVYVEFGATSTDTVGLTFTYGSTTTAKTFNVLARQLACTAAWKAPTDCTQFFTGRFGVILNLSHIVPYSRVGQASYWYVLKVWQRSELQLRGRPAAPWQLLQQLHPDRGGLLQDPVEGELHLHTRHLRHDCLARGIKHSLPPAAHVNMILGQRDGRDRPSLPHRLPGRLHLHPEHERGRGDCAGALPRHPRFLLPDVWRRVWSRLHCHPTHLRL